MAAPARSTVVADVASLNFDLDRLEGDGRLLVDAVEMRDYPVIQAEVLLFSLQFILINLLVDVLYAVINPTIRYR